MCGIAGFVLKNLTCVNDPQRHLKVMTDALFHRGPDDDGNWYDRETGVGLGHRRLSIIELTSQGHQPMISAGGRFSISYNGEVYNYRELKKELEGLDHSFRGTSDTEVVLACIEQWGLFYSLSRFIGMFAFALWDSVERKLYLVRDRLGIKPLYYGIVQGSFVFASELKAIRSFPVFNNEIDRGSLALLLRYCYIPAPYSIYEGIFKLMPGCVLELQAGDMRTRDFMIKEYWSAKNAALEGEANPFEGSEEEAISELESFLTEAVTSRMVADVPVGTFLSGGIDSSLVTALMQNSSDRPVKTYTVGFEDPEYDEAGFARSIAGHLGTDHTEMYTSPEKALDIIPDLPALYDEPFADSSQIPTYLVSYMTRQHVKVALSGDGGDELFGGYNRYSWARDIFESFFRAPAPYRKLVSGVSKGLSAAGLNELLTHIGRLMPEDKKYFFKSPSNKFHKLSGILKARDFDELYLRLISLWQDPASVIIGAKEPMTAMTDPARHINLRDDSERMMGLDLISYLPDDILVKVDRASMGASLEARVPILDHRVVELALRLPLDMKIRNGQGKWILRQILRKYVPEDLIERPKRGFEVPLGKWLGGPLRDWTEEMLSEDRLRRGGFFEPAPIRKKWKEHLSGKRQWHYHLWNVLMFQAWLDR